MSKVTLAQAMKVVRAARALPWTASSCDDATTTWEGRRPVIVRCRYCPRCKLQNALDELGFDAARGER